VARSKLKSHMELKNLLVCPPKIRGGSYFRTNLKAINVVDRKATAVAGKSQSNDMADDLSSAWPDSVVQEPASVSVYTKKSKIAEVLRGEIDNSEPSVGLSSYLNLQSSLDSSSITSSHLFDRHSREARSKKQPLSESDPSNFEIYELSRLPGLEIPSRYIIDGRAEFCYVEPEDDNPYRFKLVNDRSYTHTDNFITFSKVCISRNHNGTVEHLSLSNFRREYVIYHQLISVKLFKRFRES